MPIDYEENYIGIIPSHICSTYQESRSEREERKATFISKATKHFDSPELREEAVELFETANPILKIPEGSAFNLHERVQNTWKKSWANGREKRG